MSDQQYNEGYTAGLASPYGLTCPYDGRTKAGKEWWRGFMAGDSERCAAKRHIALISSIGECREQVPGFGHNVCTRDKGHTGVHRCKAADVDARLAGRPTETEKLTCEVNLETGEFRVVPERNFVARAGAHVARGRNRSKRDLLHHAQDRVLSGIVTAALLASDDGDDELSDMIRVIGGKIAKRWRIENVPGLPQSWAHKD